MPQCAQCHEEIDHLLRNEKVWRTFETRLVNGQLEFLNSEVLDSLGTEDGCYGCPLCYADLDLDDKGVIDLLSKA